MAQKRAVYEFEGTLQDLYSFLKVEPQFLDDGHRLKTIYELLHIRPICGEDRIEIPRFLFLKNRIDGLKRVPHERLKYKKLKYIRKGNQTQLDESFLVYLDSLQKEFPIKFAKIDEIRKREKKKIKFAKGKDVKLNKANKVNPKYIALKVAHGKNLSLRRKLFVVKADLRKIKFSKSGKIKKLFIYGSDRTRKIPFVSLKFKRKQKSNVLSAKKKVKSLSNSKKKESAAKKSKAAAPKKSAPKKKKSKDTVYGIFKATKVTLSKTYSGKAKAPEVKYDYLKKENKSFYSIIDTITKLFTNESEEGLSR